jgi:hypothetical protein
MDLASDLAYRTEIPLDPTAVFSNPDLIGLLGYGSVTLNYGSVPFLVIKYSKKFKKKVRFLNIWPQKWPSRIRIWLDL